jgi:hypothetical protein
MTNTEITRVAETIHEIALWDGDDIDRAENAFIKRAMGTGEGVQTYINIKRMFENVREVKRHAV